MKNSEQTTDEAQQFKSQILGEAGDKDGDTENIYLDLDTILDTRLGTIAKINPELAVRVLNSKKYHTRIIDEFDGVNTEEFKREYAKRDLDTLRMSVLTNVVYFLRRLIKDSLISSVISHKVEKLCFTVNVYPYDFNDPGLTEMLINCIRFHTYSTSSVTIVSIPDEELTPEFCKDNFQIMIRYGWVHWVAMYKSYFEKNGCPEMAYITPELFFDVVPTQEQIADMVSKEQNPFTMNEDLTARMFRLKHMPVSLFSMHEKITKENAGRMAQFASITEDDIKEYLDKVYPKADLVHDTPLPNVDLSEAYELL